MRGVVWLVLLFAVAVVAATTLGSNDGLVSIYWSGWRTDLSLNLFVILLLAVCALLFVLVQTVHAIGTLPQRAKAWRDLRKERSGQAALREAFAEHFSARFARSAKAASRALEIQRDNQALREDPDFAALAQLIGAASLHRLQDRKRRDEWLAQAWAAGAARGRSRVDEGLQLQAAEWALDDHDLTRAQALLADLPAGVARRTQALRLKLQASRAAGDPLQALHTARLLANHGAFTRHAAQGLLRTLAGEALDSAHDRSQLRRVWDQLENDDRRDPFVASRAAQRAVALSRRLMASASAAALPVDAVEPAADVTDPARAAAAALEAAASLEPAALLGDAREWLRPFWDRIGDCDAEQRAQLAQALIAALPGLGADWLPRLEAALAAQPQDRHLKAAVGLAFAERQLWGKSRRLLEEAADHAELGPGLRRRCWRGLAKAALAEHDEERAARCERQAAALD